MLCCVRQEARAPFVARVCWFPQRDPRGPPTLTQRAARLPYPHGTNSFPPNAIDNNQQRDVIRLFFFPTHIYSTSTGLTDNQRANNQIKYVRV